MRSFILAALALLAFSGAPAQEVHRCGNQYSDTPCGQGKRVDVSPALRDPNSAGSSQIFLCVSHNGGRFWSATHCREQNALVERIEPVPAGLSWEEQLQIADRQTRQGHATQRQQMQARAAVEPGNTGARGDARDNCAYWNEQVARYDALARRPQSAEQQGWIAERRKETRDAQFRARC